MSSKRAQRWCRNALDRGLAVVRGRVEQGVTGIALLPDPPRASKLRHELDDVLQVLDEGGVWVEDPNYTREPEYNADGSPVVNVDGSIRMIRKPTGESTRRLKGLSPLDVVVWNKKRSSLERRISQLPKKPEDLHTFLYYGGPYAQKVFSPDELSEVAPGFVMKFLFPQDLNFSSAQYQRALVRKGLHPDEIEQILEVFYPEECEV